MPCAPLLCARALPRVPGARSSPRCIFSVSCLLSNLHRQHRQEEDPIRCLLRFLGACSGEVEDAMKMLRRDLQWREQMGILELRNKTINDVVGDAGAVEVIDELLPTKFLGRDFQGRPVLYRKLSPAWTAAKCCNQDMRFNISKFQEWQAWIMERMLDQLNRQGCCVCIVDVSGWSSTSMSMDFLTWGKALQKLVTEHYPQRVLHTYIINAPPAFSAAERYYRKRFVFFGTFGAYCVIWQIIGLHPLQLFAK